MKILILAVSMACAFGVSTSAPLRAAESKLAETKDEYAKKARVELDELGRKIDALETKAKDAGADVREGMDAKLKALKARRKTASKDLAKLKRASGKAWTGLKAGVDKGIAEMKEELGKE